MSEEKTNIDKLEDALKKFWRDHGAQDPIRGKHTEVMIEPKFFLGGELNPQVRDLLISVYLSNSTYEDVKRGKVSINKSEIIIKDKFGKPIITIKNQKMIKEFTNRLQQ